MSDVILDTIKDNVGGGAIHEHFDGELIDCVNAAIMELGQIGVSTPDGFIVNNDSTWSDYLGDDTVLLGCVPKLLSLKVRMLFDPPSGSVSDEINKQIDRLEWRLNSYHETGM